MVLTYIEESSMNRYLNLVLTVIAVALVSLVVEIAIPLVHAQSGITRVALCDLATNRCASVGVNGIDGTSTATYSLLVRQ
jgi:hypothetical protein